MQSHVADALVEAANLLLVGMVVVFLFLSMLIGAITLIAWINKLFPDETRNSAERHAVTPQSTLSSSENLSPKTLAVISTAIFQHRQSH
ncbi:OadG family protein [uncultured Paraglaciecola sp.]|uniref:OadG family protein n=1 Tax=uncultured Paraglaciecola sp. TaxID=1765024 RepID=UPI002601FFD2|nr:OadG family protein [uncultured Paraglaciecola sp.]